MRWLRKVEFSIRNNYRQVDLDSSQFRIRFDVRHKLADHRGSVGMVEIFNLSPDTENDLMIQNIRCFLNAGYQEETGLLYEGTILRIERGRENVDRYLRIHLRSGLELESVMTFAFSGPVGVRSAVDIVVRKIARQPQFENVVLDRQSLKLIPSKALVENWSFTGPARLALDELMAGIPPLDGRYRLSWNLNGNLLSIVSTDNVREFIDLGGYYRGVQPPQQQREVTVSEDNGMIGLPEQLEAGIRVRSLLIPSADTDLLMEIIPPTVTREVDNRSRYYAGKKWRVVDIRHSGDSWGGDYFTELEGKILD